MNSEDEYVFTRDGKQITTKLFFEGGYWWTVYQPYLKATSINLQQTKK